MPISMQCEFWAVGQGLFSSGRILSGGNTAFSWVYDCGSVKKSRPYLQNSIREMRSHYPENLDFLMISHFDEDHISGIPDLLRGKKVKWLMLPYFPLWKRLIIALEKGISSEKVNFMFYLDPVKYLAENCSTSFDENSRILLLSEAVDDEVKFPFSLKPLEELGSDEDIIDDFVGKNNIKTLLVKPGFGFKVWGDPAINGIEFIPYNAPVQTLSKAPKNLGDFRQTIKSLVGNVKQMDKKLIEDIKAIYDAEFVRFNKKSEDRNIISTFLYIGAILPENQSVDEILLAYYHNIYCCQKKTFCFSEKNNKQKNKTGILYTGDGYLKKQQDFDNLYHALGEKRMNNIACFQALHHGSRKNYRKGVANVIAPRIAVFSADPSYANYNHPHADVVKEFLPYNPMLVNQQNYLKMEFYFY